MKDSKVQFFLDVTQGKLNPFSVLKSEVKRVMMEFSFIKSVALIERLTIERSRHNYTYKYVQLCKDFYLKM